MPTSIKFAPNQQIAGIPALFISAIPDDSTAKVKITPEGRLSYGLTGSCNVYFGLKNYPGKKQHLILDSSKSKQPYSLQFTPEIIFNQISDADSHAKGLKICAAFCEKRKIPVINHPNAILRTQRDQIYESLSDVENLIVPKSIRCQPKSPNDVRTEIEGAELTYPVIMRSSGSHGGIDTIRLNSPENIEEKMYQVPMDGRSFYITEFHDYRSNDGLYRKYRIAVVGGIPIVRHVITSDSWLIHSSSRKFMKRYPKYIKEEVNAIKKFTHKLKPRIEPVIDEITKILRLEECINQLSEVITWRTIGMPPTTAIRYFRYSPSLER